MTSRPTLAYADKFLTSIDVAPKTGVTYRTGLHTLAEFLAGGQRDGSALGAAGVLPLRLLQDDTLARFRHWMRTERRYSRRTEGTYLAAAVRFVEWLDANQLLPSSLASSRLKLVLQESRGRRRVGYKTQPIKDAVPLIIEYYQSLPLPAPKTPRLRRQRLTLLRNRAIVQMLFATGLRAQELASLRRSDCADGDSDKILITGKGEKERLVMLNPEAQAAVRAYLQARDEEREKGKDREINAKEAPLFVRHDRDKLNPISTKTVWQIISQAARALELETAISPHDFRRYIATALLSEGMPLESVQAFLGHESIVTTRTVYAHTWTEVLEDQVKTYRPAISDAVRRAKRKVERHDR
jgi:site-specific recombinase XerD